MEGIDVPFEPTPEGPLLDDHVHFTGEVVVMAATIPVPPAMAGGKEGQHWPALVFRFAAPDGSGYYPATCLVLEDDRMAKLRPLVMQSIHHAREQAKAKSA